MLSRSIKKNFRFIPLPEWTFVLTLVQVLLKLLIVKIIANQIAVILNYQALSNCSLSHLVKIAIQAPAILSDSDLEEIVNVWQKKNPQFDI